MRQLIVLSLPFLVACVGSNPIETVKKGQLSELGSMSVEKHFELADCTHAKWSTGQQIADHVIVVAECLPKTYEQDKMRFRFLVKDKTEVKLLDVHEIKLQGDRVVKELPMSRFALTHLSRQQSTGPAFHP
ncbi:MAG: hypothetical protein QE278_06325 [Limnobacter sp.]|nr:hypothetical protein [Limnobacter sp.]